MLQFSPIPPCQYLLSILRFEERELVSIFMDVVKHEILAVFPTLLVQRAHTYARERVRAHTCPHHPPPSKLREKLDEEVLSLLAGAQAVLLVFVY